MAIEASQWKTVAIQEGETKNGAGEGWLFKGQQGDMTFCVTARFTAGTQALIPLMAYFWQHTACQNNVYLWNFVYIDRNKKEGCSAFGWDRINFLRSSLYGAMFCTCDENSVDNTGMF